MTGEPADALQHRIVELEQQLRDRQARLEQREELINAAMLERGQVLLQHVLRSRELSAQYSAASRLDSVSGLMRHGLFRGAAEFEVERARRCGWPLAMVVAAVDQLDAINEQSGYRHGDAVLSHLGQSLKALWIARPAKRTPSFGRESGARLGLLLPACDAEELELRTEDVRRMVECLPLGSPQPTCSVGGALLRSGERTLSLIARARSAALRARQRGGNAVALDDSEMSQ